MTIEEAQDRINELENDLEKAEQRIEELEDDIEDAETERDDLQEKLDAMDNSHFISALETIADWSNWTENKWTPALTYLEHPADIANEVLNENK